MRLNRWEETWPLDERRCPCDVHFVEYLAEHGISGKSIFHFGTGEHHLLGVSNAARPPEERNEILGVTASIQEYQAYMQLVSGSAETAKWYKALFADIYTLTARALPSFDLVTLFHLCEFYHPDRSRYAPLDDAGLVALFIGKLNPGGQLVFYRGSSGWDGTAAILDGLVRRRAIAPAGGHRSLVFYRPAAGHP
jgi:hypothetical protein